MLPRGAAARVAVRLAAAAAARQPPRARRLHVVIPRDVPRAIRLFARACDAGSMFSCTHLGHVLAVDDPARAVAPLTSACDAGLPEACADLGELRRLGRGVPRDPLAALAMLNRRCRSSRERP